jgi:hypothetical protein
MPKYSVRRVTSRSTWQGNKKKCGPDYSSAKHSSATSRPSQKQDGRQKMAANKFVFLYFCPHVFAFPFRLVLFRPSQPLFEFRGTGRFQKQLDRLGNIAARFLDGFALANNVQFGAQRHKIFFRTLDDGSQRKFRFAFHTGILRQ